MGKTWMAMVAMAALAAGCLQAPVPPRAGELLPPSTDRFVEAHDGCTGYLLAALVDPLRTDAHLPPGFHLRDPRDFLRGVGTGQALLLVSATVCAPTRDAPAWRNAVASLFVQPPSVPGERPPADYDLYEVEHYSPEPQVQRRLQAWGWPVANVSLEDESVPEARTHVFAFAADAGPVPFPSAGDNPPLFRFGG
ncbi:MAG TPA: hypothetical protein VHI93_05455, partial [Candidatus Thermoplasmatota archaeon]|nr:hypothetical protein [Candidatus Thermoplasmatota archaeon]